MIVRVYPSQNTKPERGCKVSVCSCVCVCPGCVFCVCCSCVVSLGGVSQNPFLHVSLCLFDCLFDCLFCRLFSEGLLSSLFVCLFSDKKKPVTRLCLFVVCSPSLVLCVCACVACFVCSLAWLCLFGLCVICNPN